MEIQLVHTTGSPSRHDSDSESSYDKNRQVQSSSEMALHRKQSRRCKKQMSERQRRKRMNKSMDKLGLLVYGKTFKDGLKVDKATLLNDAFEKLETMKDDYHKGYQTAISSIETFLSGMPGCPPEVRNALSRHLNSTLQGHLHRCHSSTEVHPSEECSSDSCGLTPATPLAPEVKLGQECHLDAHRVSTAFASKSSWRLLTPEKTEASVQCASRKASSSHPLQRPDMKKSSSPSTALPDTPSRSACPANDVSSRGHDVTRVTHAASSLGTPSCQPIPLPSRSRSSWRMTVTHSADPHAAGQEPSVSGPFPPSTFFPYLSYSPSPPSSCTPKIEPYVTPYAPQNPLYLGATPLPLLYGVPSGSTPSGQACGVPKTTPSNSLLGSHPYPILHPLPALTPTHHAEHTPIHQAEHTPGYYGGSCRADDSGYMSPVVPCPLTPLTVAQYGGVKKRYLKEMMMQQTTGRAADETDEENDREVEEVLSGAARRDSGISSTL